MKISMISSLIYFSLFQANYYYVLKQTEHDRGKNGFRFSFSAPS